MVLCRKFYDRMLKIHLRYCLIFFSAFAMPLPGQALTPEQFFEACGHSPDKCRQSSFAQIYLGGVLDALGTLNGHLRPLGKERALYCRPEKEIFDPKRIIDYVYSVREQYKGVNVVEPVLAYLKENGGCKGN